jgi:hypothetical protein
VSAITIASFGRTAFSSLRTRSGRIGIASEADTLSASARHSSTNPRVRESHASRFAAPALAASASSAPRTSAWMPIVFG